MRTGTELPRSCALLPEPHRRATGLFIAYGLLAGLAVLLTFGTLIDWPAVVKLLVLLLLILLLVAWLIVVALTAVLRWAGLG